MTRTGTRASLTSLALAAALLAACGQGAAGGQGSSDGQGGDATPGTSASSPAASPAPEPAASTPATAAPDDEDPLGDFSPPATELTAEPSGERVTVVDVRVGTHDGYDRVVYEVAGGGIPGWRVTYVDQAVQDGSGEPVEVAGDAVLDVWLTGTGYPQDTGQEEFAQDVGPRQGTVVEVTRPLTFEGMTQSVVGVDGAHRPFRVFVLQDPVRVVVDVQQG